MLKDIQEVLGALPQDGDMGTFIRGAAFSACSIKEDLEEGCPYHTSGYFGFPFSCSLLDTRLKLSSVQD